MDRFRERQMDIDKYIYGYIYKERETYRQRQIYVEK